MADELPYRLAVAAILLGTITVAGYHRLQAARSKERISHREEGLWFATCLRLFGLASALAVLAYIFAPRLVEWAQVAIPTWLRWLGAACGAVNTLLFAWTLHTLGKNLTDTVVTRANATLVTRGPYRFVRHPFYVCTALLYLSVSLLAANALIAILAVAAMSMLVLRTTKEERFLVARFGADYETYMAKTPRFIPRWPSS